LKDFARMTTTTKARPLFDPPIVRRALVDSVLKLNPRGQVRNPVMFTVFIGSILTTGLGVYAFLAGGSESPIFILGVSAWLWFTVLFANFAEAMAEGRGKAQADALRATRRDVTAKELEEPHYGAKSRPTPASLLRKGNFVLVEAGEFIPGDGEVVEGVASVDESAITGESAPVIRESGGDRSSVTGGTRVLSDWLVIRITANPGERRQAAKNTQRNCARHSTRGNDYHFFVCLRDLAAIFQVQRGSRRARHHN
jgi:K+-transporting ATPase ATPase B chain